jgi:pyruvate,water dikinase
MIACDILRARKSHGGVRTEHPRMNDVPSQRTNDTPYVLWLQDVDLDDLALVGGKAASLGELHKACAGLGVGIPPGFVLTAQAWRALLDQAGLQPTLDTLLEGLDTTDPTALAKAGAQARALVLQAPLPAAVESALRAAWRELARTHGPAQAVAVRSSATAEDLPHASFAGQHDSFLAVVGEDAVVEAVRQCQASLYTDRAIAYRATRGFAHQRVALAVAVTKMVRSDLAASGVVFTLDTESGHPDVVLVQATWGLGESLVQGTVDPDEYLVHKRTFEGGARCVLRHRIGGKQTRVVPARATGPMQAGEAVLRTEAVPQADRRRACLSDEAVLGLTGAALAIERHYSRRAGHWCPMDIEWAQDGPGGTLCIVQARPETVASRRPVQELLHHVLLPAAVPARVLVCGRAVGEGIASGSVRVVDSIAALPSFQAGEILVAPMTTPDWEPVMKRAAAIVTERGGRTCHAAIVARELGIPAVVGATGALSALTPGRAVTVSCAEGETARVYEGVLEHRVERTDLGALPHPRTRLMVNLGNPALAWKTAMLPCDGVGLARMEFIVSEHVGAHPMALLHPDRIADPATRQRIEALWQDADCASGAAYFVEKLSEGVGTIAAAFWPRPVVVRLSDFKSSEYAGLPGGADFEPSEANPMIGLRGAARYVHPVYADAFALECQALARVRSEMGMGNLAVMVPFCRRLQEAREVLAAMAAHGLARGSAARPGTSEPGLEVWMMCEIPNNVLLIDEFAACFDGFSIGSNDLTQLTLGVDRDSALLASSFDEADPGMLRSYRLAIEGAHRHGRPVGICGQAPSDRPELVRELVGLGIDSLSLSPDRWLATLSLVAAAEASTG